ncbi:MULTISPECIES: lasso peptide biosynthesis B2 protein [Kitasatospora]|uniref:lasso peptide biosynthesis B2 protein n=1 Tax=Kitasatospora TaxID=2063 RepID=UPI0005274A2A|nr:MULTISPECIES: lasso peptide biosynthesis B2 protein [Kitasatospora]
MRPPLPTVHTVTALTRRAGVVVNYRNGETVLLTGDALNRWLAALENSPAPAPVLVHDPAVSWGTSEVPVRLPAVGRPPLAWRIAATAVLATTLAVRTAGPRSERFGRLRRLAETGSALPPPSAAHASLAVRSIRWAAGNVPARVACLEESAAAALLLTLGGRGGVWRHGIATDPIRLHAWICDGDGRPVEEPAHTDHYTPINPRP